MRHFSTLIALAAAITVAVIGFRYGTYAVGGSDSSCYGLMADAFAAGKLQPTSDLVAQVPWPEAPKSFTPGGFVPSETRPDASVPVCAPGFSLLLAPLVAAGGRDAIFILTPIAGALLVWLAFLVARHIAGPLAGALAAILVAVSPPMLYQVVQPMNDVATAALWMATLASLITRRWTLAGACCGLALLVRPNLLPLATIAVVFAGIRDWAAFAEGSGEPRRSAHNEVAQRRGSRIRAVTQFAVAAFPFGLLVLWLNHVLYGGALRTGYGQLGHLFGLSAVALNGPRYLSWLVETHTPFPLLAFAAPLVLPREKRPDAWLLTGLIVATCALYFFYTPFDEWSYLRFLLPAIAFMLVLASSVTVTMLKFAPATGRTVIVGAIATGLAIFCVRVSEDRLAFNLRFLEQRFRSAGVVVREALPPDAVVLSVWDSGAVRFHGRKEALTWAGLDGVWLDRALAWLDQHGHPPYIMLESWEEPAFRSRFGNDSDIGKLDWPPKYEVDRSVRIYDPKDRSRYDRGERIETEYLWPLR